MTVQTTNISVEYQTGGTSTQFGFDFTCYDESWIIVYSNDVLYTGGYSVTLNDDQESNAGGFVTFEVAPDAGTLILARVVDLTQLTDYTPYTRFPAQSHEAALDKLTMIDQQLQGGIDTNAENIAFNKLAIEQNASDIAINKDNIADNATDIANNANDIAALDVRVTDNEGDIATNKADIATNKAFIDGVRAVDHLSSDNQILEITPTTLTASEMDFTLKTNVPNGTVKLDSSGQVPTEVLPPIDGMGDFRSDGTVPMSGDLNMGGNSLVNLSLGEFGPVGTNLSLYFIGDPDTGLLSTGDNILQIVAGITNFSTAPLIALDGNNNNITIAVGSNQISVEQGDRIRFRVGSGDKIYLDDDGTNGLLNLRGRTRVINAQDPIDDQDLVTKSFGDANYGGGGGGYVTFADPALEQITIFGPDSTDQLTLLEGVTGGAAKNFGIILRAYADGIAVGNGRASFVSYNNGVEEVIYQMGSLGVVIESGKYLRANDPIDNQDVVTKVWGDTNYFQPDGSVPMTGNLQTDSGIIHENASSDMSITINNPNQITDKGKLRIQGVDDSGNLWPMIIASPDSGVDLSWQNQPAARTVSQIQGGLEAFNFYTGSGWERVLTESDLPPSINVAAITPATYNSGSTIDLTGLPLEGSAVYEITGMASGNMTTAPASSTLFINLNYPITSTTTFKSESTIDGENWNHSSGANNLTLTIAQNSTDRGYVKFTATITTVDAGDFLIQSFASNVPEFSIDHGYLKAVRIA